MLATERYSNYIMTILLYYLIINNRLLLTEAAGKACRDDSVEGLRFYPNRFLEEH